MKKRIAVYAICKNEENHVTGFLQNVITANEIILVDTGSTDKTREIVKALNYPNVRLVDATFEPFRFDQARTFALNQVSDDIDYCVWLDLDERLTYNWYNMLQEVFKHSPKRLDCVKMMMNFHRRDDGTVVQEYYQTKCHDRHSYFWKYPCHEALIFDEDGQQNVYAAARITIEHLKEEGKERNYLPMLELGVRSYPGDQRALYYYGREFFYQGNYTSAIEVLKGAILAPHAVWDRQTAEAYHFIAQAYEKLEKPVEAEQHYLKYVSLNIDHAEAWVALAEFYYYNSMPLQGLGAALRAQSLDKEPVDFLIRNTDAWSWKAYDLAALCSGNLGMIDKAVYYGNLACMQSPEDQRLHDNLEHYVKQLKGE